MVASKESDPGLPGSLDAFKEHLAARRECASKKAIWLIGTDVETRRGVLFRKGCGMWECPVCGRKLAIEWVHKIAYGVQAYMDDEDAPWSFLTVTARGDRRGTTKSLDDFRRGWPKACRRVKRAWPGELHYAAIPELHHDEAGTVHMHMLVNRRFDAREYSKRGGGTVWFSRTLARHLAACGLGWSHDARPIDESARAAMYAFKYATKQAGEKTFPKSLRHVRTTHRWPVHNNGTRGKSDLDWSVCPDDRLFDELASLTARGYNFA